MRPVSRRRLYWTARAVFVSDPAHVAAFDRVFAEVFGERAAEAEPPEDVSGADAQGSVDVPSPPGRSREGDEEIEVPSRWPATRSGWRASASTSSTRPSSRSSTG